MMLTSAHNHTCIGSDLFRWFARASSAILFIAWIALVIEEAIVLGAPAPAAVYQAVAFAIIFIGYAVGWRHELAGGLVTIAGMAVFLAAFIVSFNQLPQLTIAWFVFPGLLYLLAWRYDQRHATRAVRQS